MDSLFHFGTPDIKPYKKKNLSLVPSEFFKRDSNLTNENIEEGLSSPIFKKSKFSDAPTPKIFNFSLINCNKNEDDEETCANVEDKPISPIKMDGHISMASKNILNEVHSKSIKSKTLAPIFTNKIILDSNKKSIDELKLYETQISFKNLDVKEEILENIGENDNDESLNKNFKEKLAKMNILSNPIKPQPMIKFVEAVKMTEMNSFDKINTKKAKDQNKLESDINNHQYRHLIFAPYCTESTFKKHLTLTYRGLVYSKKCLKGPSESFIKSKQVNLIESKVPRYKTLLLDLDETLIHTCNLKESPDHVIKTNDGCGNENSIGLNIRPFCLEFLEKLSKFYEIFIFTASSSNYANTIVNYLDPESKYINGILTRNNCMETKNGFFVKDLRIIKNRELKNMIIVDNLAHSFGFQIENGIPILEWHNNKKKDSELKYLMDYLLEILYADDVREFNKKRLRLIELAFLKMEDLNL